MLMRTTPYGLLDVRRKARLLWSDRTMQRRWVRAWLIARKHGGLLLEGAPAQWRSR